MLSENNFIIEFPADRDYIPFFQNFLRDYLKNFNVSNEFSEKATKESECWFSSIIREERVLHTFPTIDFKGKILENILYVQIKVPDMEEFKTSLVLEEKLPLGENNAPI